MTVSKAQQKAVHKYVRENYDRIGLTLPRGRKEDVEKRAKELGQSINSYICALIQSDMGMADNEWKAQPVLWDSENKIE